MQELRDEMTRVEEDLLEADAKNRLYYLLGERTRREHMAIDQKVGRGHQKTSVQVLDGMPKQRCISQPSTGTSNWKHTWACHTAVPVKAHQAGKQLSCRTSTGVALSNYAAVCNHNLVS